MSQSEQPVSNLKHTIKQKQTSTAGTASKKGRTSSVTIPEPDINTRTLVEQFNEAIRQAYDKLEGTLLSAVMPVARVQLIHVSQIQANDYNPNAVAGQEMKLLHTSISEDGFTQPVVAIWDPEVKKYIIIDGFHRYTTMRRYQDIVDNSKGYLPVVVLEKSIADRIASTVRHNRARGKHSVAGMGSLVFQMLEANEDDETICRKLGLEAEELARLKHITGFSKLFADRQYSKVVLTKTQNEARAEYARAHPGEILPEGV